MLVRWVSALTQTHPQNIHMFVYNQPPPVFHKVNRLPSPNSTWTIQNSLNNLDTRLLIVHHLRRIQRPGIILALLLIMLTFLNIVWQQRDLKMQPHCAQQPEYTLPHLLEVYQKPLKYGYLTRTHSGGPNSVRFRGVPLYGNVTCTTKSYSNSHGRTRMCYVNGNVTCTVYIDFCG